MALFTTSLNSGSNGNCYYVGNEDEAVLIDAGISCRETEKRMKKLGLCMSKVKAIFISHEHTDHIKGVPSIAQKLSIPVYITDATLRGCQYLNTCSTVSFQSDIPVQIGALSITAFQKLHDAEDPHSFVVSGNGVTIGIFTDIGRACVQVQKNFGLCHAAYLEANYDDTLLENGNYPYFLKKRIMGDRGHLSNIQALEIFKRFRPVFMTHLFLSHLSKDNNCPVKAKDLFEREAGNTHIIIASRHEQSDLFKIAAKEMVALKPRQMSLF